MVLGYASISWAQPDPNKVSLKTLIEEALEKNPDLKSVKESWQAAKRRIAQSSALPDPMAGYSIMGPDLETRLGPQEEIYEFEQEIPFPGKLVEKRNIAKAEGRMAETRVRLTERELIFKVSQTYYELFAVERTIKILEEVKDLLLKLESITQARYASQQGSQRDVAKTQSEVSEVLERLFVLRQQKETLQAYLKSLLNRDTDTHLEVVEELSLPALSVSLDELLVQLKQTSPEYLEALALQERESFMKNLAQYENAPDFKVGFQYYRIGEGMTTDPDDGRDAWMIPIKVSLPLWQNRIGSAIEEAQRNLKAAQAKLKGIENTTEYELKNAYYQFVSQKQIVELYQNAFIPQADLALRSDQAGYEAGKIEIINFIDSERVYLNAKIAYYQALAEALKSFAGIEKILGKDLDQGGRL